MYNIVMRKKRDKLCDYCIFFCIEKTAVRFTQNDKPLILYEFKCSEYKDEKCRRPDKCEYYFDVRSIG